MKYPQFLGSLLLASCIAADEDHGAKGPEDMPAAAPVEHGVLHGGAVDAATLSPSTPLHAWHVQLGTDARVEIRTGRAVVGPDVDTVVYVYPAGDDAWIARADDAEGSLFATLAEDLPAGAYDVVVKGYRADTAGAFEVRFTCEQLAGAVAPDGARSTP